MNMSVFDHGSQKANRRTKLAVDISEVNDHLESLSNVITFQDGEIAALSNAIIDYEAAIESLSNNYYPWKSTTNSKILTLYELDLMCYAVLINLHDEIDALSNTLVNDYAQRFEKLSFSISEISKSLGM